MKVCKFCGSEFDGSSDLFCSKSCQGKYAASFVKNHKCNFKHHNAEYGRWKCSICNLIFETRKQLFQHTKTHRLNPNEKLSWNKGLTKETDIRLKIAGEKFSKKVKSGAIKLGHPITDEVKKRISESMKKAHAEGRAYNIGKSRWNNQPSYPEQFFMKVIENEFIDKNYQREMPFYRFSLDFAWPDKKKVIEIDGEQHERFDEYKLRDQEKDKLLNENNWKILRIKWKDMMKNPKYWIKHAKDFIE